MPETNLKAGSVTIDIKGNMAGLLESLKNANAKLRAFSQDVIAMGKKTLAVGTGITAGLTAAAKLFADTGDQAAKAARRVGISVEAMQELAYAAALAGADMSFVEKALDRMMKNLGDAQQGIAKPTLALKQLGLSLKELDKLNTEEKFLAIADAIAKLNKTNPALANTLLKDMFGRAGTQLLPLLTSDIAAARQEARDLGIVLSQESAAKAEVLTDAFYKLGQVTKHLVVQLGEKLAKAVYDDIQYMLQLGKVAMKAINSDLFKELINDAFELGKILMYAGGTMIALGTAGKLLSTVIGLLLNPLSLFVGLLGAGAVAALWYAEKIGLLQTNVFGFVASIKVAGVTLNNWGAGAFEAMTAAATIMWKVLKRIFANVVEGFADMVEKLFNIELGNGAKLGDVFTKALLNLQIGVNKTKIAFADFFTYIMRGFRSVSLAALNAAESMVDAARGDIFGISDESADKAISKIRELKKSISDITGGGGYNQNQDILDALAKARGQQENLEGTWGFGKFPRIVGWKVSDTRQSFANALDAAKGSSSEVVRDLAKKYEEQLDAYWDVYGGSSSKRLSEFNQFIGNALDSLEAHQPKVNFDESKTAFQDMKRSAQRAIHEIEEELASLEQNKGKIDYTGTFDNWREWADQMRESSKGMTDDFRTAMDEIRALLDPENQPVIDSEGQAKDFYEQMKAAVAKIKKEIEDQLGFEKPADDFEKKVKETLEGLGGLDNIIEQSDMQPAKLGSYGSYVSSLSFKQMFGDINAKDDPAKQQIEELKRLQQLMKEQISATKEIDVGAAA